MQAEIRMISIRKDDYDNLVANQKLLQALQSAGVDNWEGYDEAREAMDEDYK
jgi:hypothetical protein